MNENIKGVIAYIFGFIGGLIILFGFKDSERITRFHASQATTVSVICMVAAIIFGFIPVIKYINILITLGYIAFVVIGCIKAYNVDDYEIPVLTDLTRKIFGNIIEG